MSLDVHLYGKAVNQECSECGHIRPVQDCVYSANITHNLNNMADAAGIYQAVWHPEACGIVKASQLIGPLRRGIALMKACPEVFRAFNAPNGWGTYDRFLPWLEAYLKACEENPDAEVKVSR